MRKEILWSAMLAAAMLVGCDDKSSTPPAPPTSPTAPKVDMDKAADSAKDAAKSTGDAMKSSADAMKDTAKSTGDAMKDSTATPAPADGAVTSMNAADAQAKLTKVMDYIKDHKYDMADSTLKELESHKSMLPAALQSQVDNARKMLDTAKAGSSMSIPGMTK